MMNMKALCKRNLVALLFSAVLLAPGSLIAAQKTEDQLIAELDNPNGSKVASTMLAIEKQYPNSTKAFPRIKTLLKDNRPEVRRKAARVLGALHAEVSSEDLKNIVVLIKSNDAAEAIDGLKALRGLKAQETIPDIKMCLNSPTPNVMRDACRTLAVLGTKTDIPAIEPLLTNKNPAVQKDANDAIFALKEKP
jgi:HEAT repeat protein